MTKFSLAAMLLIVAASACPVKAQFGLQLELETPPSMVTTWEEPLNQFSVAMKPKTQVFLSSSMARKPRVSAASHDKGTLTMIHDYYSRRDQEYSLVPVTVDARALLTYRLEKNFRQSFREGNYKTFTAADDGRSRGGLGISVGLPKRLDRIFGEGGAGLKVAGYRRIMFAGRSQWTDAAESEIYRQNKFPSLRMEQISRFDITGTIGTKISVKVSQDSQTDIPLANRIQIRYKGDDDDILKSIEAGNTTLSLPNTKFVGYSSRINGLFGVKAEAQIGNLNVIGIASQEKGSTERASFTATGEENADYFRDYEYVERRIFDLGLPADPATGREAEFARGDSIINLFVYETVSSVTTDLEANPANFWVDPFNKGAYTGEDDSTSGGNTNRVRLLTDEEYDFFDDRERNLHYVIFSRPRDINQKLGCWMQVKKENGDIVTYGNIDNPPYDLKLIALERDKMTPDMATYPLMWRNCYRIPANVDIKDIRVKIFKGLPGTEGNRDNLEYQVSQAAGNASYVEITGLDQENESGVRSPDGLLDDLQDVFRPDLGLLIFPHRRPFDTDTTYVDANGVETPQLAVKVPTIYDYASQSQKVEKSEYYLQMITTARSSKIKLDRANIIEGSETITVNGRQLARGTDYQINYEFGQITLLNEDAMDPNASLSIDYEYAPFFAVQKKTLLGARAEYEWSKDFKVGSTFLYKSDKTQERKPKVGQETAQTIILDGDMSLKLHPNFLTKMANAVPLVETESPSNISIEAEVAQSRPNPNVDNVAYVDDFESALEQLSLGMARTRWKTASEPYVIAGQEYQKTKMLWHTPRELVNVDEVYDRETAQGEGTLRTLRLIFRPDTALGTDSWSGIMRYFGSSLDAKRAQLFEIRLLRYDNIEATLHFDFGRINEDLDQDGFAFTEDLDINDAVSEEEDVGLDGIADGQGETPTQWGTEADPAGDNWYFQGQGKCPFFNCDTIDWDSEEWYYEFLNGTEGNRLDPSVIGLPDEENLSRGTSGMETNDAYFSFSLDLASDSFLVPNSERNGWVTYRIPIRDSAAVDDFVSSGALRPDWNKITHVRVWFEAAPGQIAPDTIEIADWYFVQSNWQDSVIFGPDSALSNTKFIVAEMSDDENQDFTPPPGVDAYTDPTTNVTEAQRALLLDFTNLRNTDSCLATKDLLTVDRYSGYRRLEMFVYGDYDDPTDEGKVEFFFRLGQDATNYYEYYTTVYQGWDDRNAVNIDFNEMTALKDEAMRNLESGVDVNVDDGEHYRILGSPDINKVRYFAAGLINTDPDSTHEVSGQIWLDELRVSDVRRDVGTAGRVTIIGNMADLFNYNLSFESQDPYFRGLSTSTRGGSTDNLGSGETRTTQSYGVTLNINKFLPRSWGARLPVTIWYDRSVQTPLLRTNSDIVLPEEVRQEEQTIRETRRVSVSSSFNRKGRNPVFNLLLNRLKTSASYQRFTMTSVTTPYNFGESYNVRSTFDFNVDKPPTVAIFSWTKSIPVLKKASETRLWLYPERWTSSANFSRNLTITDDINNIRRTSNKRTFDGKMDMKYRVFNTLTLTYNYNTNRDLSNPDMVNIALKNFKLGLETHYGQNLTGTYDPKLFEFFTTGFSYKVNYTDDWQRSYEARRSALSRTMGVSGQFDHEKLLGKEEKKPRRRAPTRREETDGLEKKGTPIYKRALTLLRQVTGWIDPIGYSYNESYNNSLPGMATRPSWQYRFGLRDEAEVPNVTDAVGTRTATESVRYDLSSGFTFLGGVVTRVKFARSINTDVVKQGTRYESTSTTWPDLSIRIQKFKKFPAIKDALNKFIEIFAPRTGFNRQTKEQKDIANGFTTSRTVDNNYKPLLSLSFKAFRSLSLTAAYSLDKSNQEKFSPTTGELQTETVSTRKSLAMSGKYSLVSGSGISLPFFGKLKFKSTVDFEMTVRLNSNISETAQSGGPFVTSVDKSDVMFTPVVSYTFSRQMKGGLTMRWQDSNDNHRGRKSHTREVQIWTEISF